MTAPSKVSGSPRNAIRARDVLRARRFPVSDGAPVEVVESSPSIAGNGRVAGLRSDHPARVGGVQLYPASAVAVRSRRLRLPGVASRPRNHPGDGRLPHATAQLVRAPGVLPADGKRRLVLYLHGGAFLTCGVNSHSRIVNALPPISSPA